MGFISPDTYDSYELEVRLTSTNADDDNIGVICGWHVDPATGRQFTLSALRDTGGTSAGWQIVYNYNRSDSKVIINSNSTVTRTGGWSSFGATGSKVRIVRAGDNFTFETTQLGNDTYDPATTLTLDLLSDPLLAKFTGASNYGYSAYSQDESTFETLGFFAAGLSGVVDVRDASIYTKGPDGIWAKSTTDTILSTDSIGRLFANLDTKKLYFAKSATEIIKVADSSGSGGGTGSAGLATRTIKPFTGGTQTIDGFKSYSLMSIVVSSAAWVRIYATSAALTADLARDIASDPIPGSGLVAEIVTTGAETVLFTPATIGFNGDSPPSNNIYMSSVNPDTGSPVTGSITILQLEA